MLLKPGITIVGEVTIYGVKIENHGGSSAETEYFLKNQDALLASAIDGGNHTPGPVKVLEFSDGTYGVIDSIRISRPPSQEKIEAFKKQILAGLTPVQKLLLSLD